MDEKSLSNLLSQLLSASQSDDLTPGEESTGWPARALVDNLQALAGQPGEPMAQAVSQFLNGEGELLETTRASLSKSSSSAVDELSQLLIKQFGLAPLIARAVAALLVKLVPSIGKTFGKEPAARKKRRTTRRKTSSGAKKPASSTKKKKKTSTRPKTTTGKKTASGKKKPATQSKKKKTTTRSKRRTSQRSGSIAESPDQGAA